MKEEMLKNREQFEWVLNTTGVGLWLNSYPLKELSWDSRTKELFVVPPDIEPTIDLFYSRLHPDDRERTAAAVEAAVRDHTLYDIDHRAIDPVTGEERWIRSVGKATYGPDGTPVRFDGINYDITRRKRVRDDLVRTREELEGRIRERTLDLEQANTMLEAEIERRKKAEHEFRTLADSAPDIIIRLDREFRHTYINPAFERVYGQPCHAFLGKTCLEIGLPQALGSLLHKGLTRVITKGEVLNFEFDRPSPNGIKRVSTHAGPILAPDGTVDSALVISRDITEKHQLEEMLRESQKMEAIGTLAGGIAHDFNNMLAVIVGSAELVLDNEDPESIRSHTIRILKASKRSGDLIRQILTFGRKRAGQRKVLRLIPLIKETTDLLRGSLPSTIRIRTDIRTVSDTILGDSSQIQQVLVNLATNGSHAMTDGGTLAIRLSEKTFLGGQRLPDHALLPGRYLKLTVRDTGTGMTAHIRKRVFEPFFTTKEPGQGTGMGLAVVYGIVKSHDGAIAVASTPGKGSIFTVFLPASTETPKESSIAHRPAAGGTERVLVVDDEPSVVAVVSETLKRLGYKVSSAPGGPEGWKKFAQNPSRYDLVITDHIMPGITGIQLAERMLGLRPDLPIILSTGYSETVSPQKARSAGISEFLMKPIEGTALGRAVRKVLDGRIKKSTLQTDSI